MRAALLFALALSTTACVSVRDIDEMQLDATGARILSARIDRGDMELYTLPQAGMIDIIATRWGRGSRQVRAQERSERVVWDARVEGDTVLLDARSPVERSGVDFDVGLPARMDLDVILDRGTLVGGNVEGVHVITADRVRGTLVGDVDIDVTQDIDLGLIPYTETDAFIRSDGRVRLALPFGLEYDLTVRGDPADEMVITELGWDDARFGEGFFSGLRGRGLVEIDITTNGPVEILELR